MQITLFIAKCRNIDEAPWVADAVDELCLEEGITIEEKLTVLRNDYGPSIEIRTALVTVPDSFLDSVFMPRVCKGVPG
jgi:hypothetical protein